MKSLCWIAVFVSLLLWGSAGAHGQGRPNVLWIVAEDLNPVFGCYGERLIKTPRIDALAKEGVRFENVFMTASVCSASRSALITGTVQTTFGLHNHRSSRGGEEIFLPKGVKTVPELFREAGYFTFNLGKEDYNFIHDLGALYSVVAEGEMDWKNRDEGQPFFAQIQISGAKSGAKPAKPVSRWKVPVPPYYPDINAFHEPLALQYDAAQLVDAEVGEILDRLKEDGLADNTAVFFFADQGRTLVRDTQFLYDPGIHVPLIVRWPGGERAKAGTVRKDLVSGIDIAATSLALVGIEVPEHFEGRNFFAEGFKREFVVAARDRCDFTVDRIRAVRTEKFKYIRNGFPERAYLQSQIRDRSPQVVEWKRLGAQGKLTTSQAAFLAATKPEEELYDLEADPHEVKNLAGEEAHGETLKKMRGMLERWEKETGDKGREPESEAGLRAVFQRWGDRCVAPEFEAIRAGAGK